MISESKPPFRRGNHGRIKLVEGLGMLEQRLGKAVAAFHARAHVANHVAHDFVWRLIRQRLERLHDGDAASIIVANCV